jgi:hypothetical protein
VAGTSTRTASTRSTPAVLATAAGTTGGRAAAAHAADSAGIQRRRRRSPAAVAARLSSHSDKCREEAAPRVSHHVYLIMYTGKWKANRPSGGVREGGGAGGLCVLFQKYKCDLVSKTSPRLALQTRLRWYTEPSLLGNPQFLFSETETGQNWRFGFYQAGFYYVTHCRDVGAAQQKKCNRRDLTLL